MANNERSWVPDGMVLDKPNPARVYDYYLGGFHNFAADRELASTVERLWPEVRTSTIAQRALLRRVIRFFTDHGMDQFLDIGSGLPTAGNVHQVVQALDPHARVVYVDNDPVVLAHGRAILRDNPNATLVWGDMRDPEPILKDREVLQLIDFDRPVGLTLNSVLHYVTDDELAYAVARTVIEALAPGSYVAIAHVSFEGAPQELVDRVVQLYRAAAEISVRARDEILRFFDGLELVEPGVVRGPLWRPEDPDDVLLDHPEHYLGFAGVGRKV